MKMRKTDRTKKEFEKALLGLLSKKNYHDIAVARKVFRASKSGAGGKTHGQTVLDNPDGHNQRARPLPLPRVRPEERREEADRGHPPVLEGPRNPLISTKTGFDRQAQNGPFKTPGC